MSASAGNKVQAEDHEYEGGLRANYFALRNLLDVNCNAVLGVFYFCKEGYPHCEAFLLCAVSCGGRFVRDLTVFLRCGVRDAYGNFLFLDRVPSVQGSGDKALVR